MGHCLEDSLVVAVGVETMLFRGADEAEVHTQRIGTSDGVGAEKILARDDKGFDLLLGEIIVYLNPSIIKTGKKPSQRTSA